MILFDYTILTVVLGSSILGAVTGALGSFAVLRRQSLLGDAISHASLPGIAIAFMLTGSKHPLILLLGAFITGWIGAILVNLIRDYTVVKEDAALGIILSVFFGFGLMLLTIIQRSGAANQTGLNTFLFGSAATLLLEDVIVLGSMAFIALSVLWLLWKEFKILTFDPDFAMTQNIPRKRLTILLTSLIVISIVIGLQTVGVVLMSALVIAPAAAARQWTHKLGKMVILSAIVGACSSVVGVLISASYAHVPTGPMIVIVLSVFVTFSLLFTHKKKKVRT